MIIEKKKEEYERNWEGLFVIEKVFSSKTYLLIQYKEIGWFPNQCLFLNRILPIKSTSSGNIAKKLTSFDIREETLNQKLKDKEKSWKN